MISSVYSNFHPITTLWDPCSDMTLITNPLAKQLGLKGRTISLNVTKVGNVCNNFKTLEYNVPLNDCHGNIHNVRTCGISEITSKARPIDTTSVAALLGIQGRDIARPHGKIDLLISIDYWKLFPSMLQTVGDLHLM